MPWRFSLFSWTIEIYGLEYVRAYYLIFNALIVKYSDGINKSTIKKKGLRVVLLMRIWQFKSHQSLFKRFIIILKHSKTWWRITKTNAPIFSSHRGAYSTISFRFCCIGSFRQKKSLREGRISMKRHDG